MRYKVYLKGFGYAKTRLTRKPKIFTLEEARKYASLERTRWSKKPRMVRLIKLK